MPFVRHGTLVASTVSVVDLPSNKLAQVEVANVDGADLIYFIITDAHDASTVPTVAGNDCEVLPATMCALRLSAPDNAPVQVKMISAGTPKFSVRAD
jgi:hypothetical protein